MTQTNQNFKAYRGDSHVLHVDLDQADGTPFDVTLGAMLRWRLTRNPSDENDAAVRKEMGAGITAVEGGVDIVLEPADLDIAAGLYYHELKVWDGEDVDTAMTGWGVIKQSAQMGSRITTLQGDLALSSTAPTRAP